MSSIFLGFLGFSSLLLHDIFQIGRKKGLILLFAIIGYSSVSASLIFLFISAPLARPGSWQFFAGLGFATVSGLLLVYSLFIELSFTSSITPSNGRQASSYGTYGMVRHPGFLWFIGLILSLNILFLSLPFLLVSLMLVIMNFSLVVIEDTVIFPILFSNYGEYKKEVPFLWPRLGVGGQPHSENR